MSLKTKEELRYEPQRIQEEGWRYGNQTIPQPTEGNLGKWAGSRDDLLDLVKHIVLTILAITVLLWPFASIAGKRYQEGYDEGYNYGYDAAAEEKYDQGYEDGFQEAQRIIFDSMTQQEFNSWWRRNQRIIQKYGMST